MGEELSYEGGLDILRTGKWRNGGEVGMAEDVGGGHGVQECCGYQGDVGNDGTEQG